ncbi:MAG: hypothetical protein G01um101413_171 [Parcubacteria group bacterium Gr01-1014_13]|nr:MAG: hypothetical protein G01um101413_171 [Parcubacteria group bacterium Gr01-1014_13]
MFLLELTGLVLISLIFGYIIWVLRGKKTSLLKEANKVFVFDLWGLYLILLVIVVFIVFILVS